MAAADHLKVPRQHGLFNHQGIDLGDGTIAHYLEGREILRSPLTDFSQGQPVTVVNHEQASAVGVTLRRAMSRIGEQNYNLLFNNCEHFAIWCKTGRHQSEQVDAVLERARQWSQIMPTSLMSALELLVEQGLLDDKGRQMARRGVQKLEDLRLKLLHKLEMLLQKANEGSNEQLLLSGRRVADALANVENLKARVDTLLKQQKLLSKADQSSDQN